MPGVIGTRKALSDVESNLQGLIASERKTNKLEETFLSGEFTRILRPVIVKMLSAFVAENFKNKKDQSGSSFKTPGEEYGKLARRMIKAGTTVYVGGGERRVYKHPGTSAWSGRRTDYLWDMMFKNKGQGLREGILVASQRTASRVQTRFSMGPTMIDEFVHQYPLKFFSGGNNPFFISREQGKRLRAVIDNLINQIKAAPRG